MYDLVEYTYKFFMAKFVRRGRSPTVSLWQLCLPKGAHPRGPDLSRRDYPQDTNDFSEKVHCRHVRDFIDSARRAVAQNTMPEHVICFNLHQCLKGYAVMWFVSSAPRRLTALCHGRLSTERSAR